MDINKGGDFEYCECSHNSVKFIGKSINLKKNITQVLKTPLTFKVMA